MKIKTIVLGWILMSIAQIANSQISFGVQGGGSFFREVHFNVPSNFYNHGFEDRGTHGYYLALITDIPIKNNFSIQGELSFITKGRTQLDRNFIQNPNPGNDWIIEDKYKFLEIPIIGKYHFSLTKKLGLDLGVGASVGYLLQHKYSITENTVTTSTIIDIPKTTLYGAKYSRWDIGPLLDLSFPTKAKFGNFILGFRGSIDLKKLNSSFNLQGQTVSSGKTYNWGMLIYTGFSFSKNNFKQNRIPSSELE